MYVVSTGENYVGFSVEGVWADETLAKWHARRLRRLNMGQHVKIATWQGTKETVLAQWSKEYSSQSKRLEWFAAA